MLLQVQTYHIVVLVQSVLHDGSYILGSLSILSYTVEGNSVQYQSYDNDRQGYYNYQYLWLKDDGSPVLLPSEGNFYQTENRYQAFAYFKGIGERTWRLVAYQQIDLK